MATSQPPEASRGAPIPFGEFVALIAALMAMGALGIDTMLPALPDIGNALHVANPNHRQFVITVFGAGFGIGHIFHGPLVDRFGRRKMLIGALSFYAFVNVLAAVSASYPLLLASRFLGGTAVAGSRVATIAMVRDCFAGRAMAKIMSLAFMVFMAVPIVAPAFGSAILLIGTWRTIFWIVTGLAVAVMLWVAARMPETMAPEDRRDIHVPTIAAAWRAALTDRMSLGYTLAGTGMTASLYGYLGSIEQVVADAFHAPRALMVVFATSAAMMMMGNMMNARLVMRIGTRRLSHGAVCVMIAVTGLHLLIAALGHETLLIFGIFQALTLTTFALSSANFSAMAMERMGHIAGTASSVQGFISLTFGSMIGSLIGQAFDGTTRPLTAGFFIAAVLALLLAFVTERGRLFHPLEH
ncbi:MAG: multidrug effflux MFS transporter [Sphingomonas bacterium]